MDAKNLDEIYEENTRTYYMKKKSTEQVNDETEMDINDDLEQQFKELDEYEKK
jgi:hypothetical protein